MELWKIVLTFLFGAGGLALINIVQERWKWKHERKATVEDREVEKEDKLDKISAQLSDYIKKQDEFNRQTSARLDGLDKQIQSQAEGMKYVLLDRILYIGQSYIKHGYATFDEKRRLREMHDVYHNALKGNGDADQIMKAVDELPLK